MTRIVVATRSAHKLREINELVPPIPGIELVDLTTAHIPPRPDEEDSLEVFETFEANALAKARYFAARSNQIVLADDSGLCVDALGGGPGVRSKRFSGRSDLSGDELDLANNEHLLRSLEGIPDEQRGAHYVCAVAIVTPEGREDVFRGIVEGVIRHGPLGDSGFGYDPLFFVPSLNATFGQISAAEKNGFSHRARAVEAAIPRLQELAAERR